MVKNQLFIAAALFVGVAIGYLLKPDAASAEGSNPAPAPVASSRIEDRGEAASVKALRARIADLEKRLAEKSAERAVSPVAETEPVASQRAERHGPPSMKEMRERMEKMAKEDPKRYAQMTNGMARWRRRRIERASAKLDFLSSVDTSGMTDEQRQAHEKYQALIERREQLEEKMHGADVTDADREDIFREMRETERALHQAARQERETLIGETAKALGFSGDDATAVSATIRDVISSTEQGHGMPPPPGGGGERPR